MNELLPAAHRLIVPEVADYEVRRELLRANPQPSEGRLDVLKLTLEYLPLTTEVMLQAATFWARERQAGMPTAVLAD